MEERKFVVEFTLVELQTIVNGLQKLPYEQVATIITSVMEQYNKQVEPPKEEKKE